MKYSILIREAAKQDILDAAGYINNTLFNPTAALKLLDEIEREINRIADNPFVCALVEDQLIGPLGIRFSRIGNFLLFYQTSEEERTISIIRFLYGKRNWSSILQQQFIAG